MMTCNCRGGTDCCIVRAFRDGPIVLSTDGMAKFRDLMKMPSKPLLAPPAKRSDREESRDSEPPER